MAVTLAQAKTQLNIPQSTTVDDAEIQLYVDAANAWVAAKVAPTDLTNPAVVLATLMLLDHLWDTQRGSSGVATPLSGDDIVNVTGVAYAIPNRVLELIGPWLAARGVPQFSFPPAIPLPDPPYITWVPGQRVPQW